MMIKNVVIHDGTPQSVEIIPFEGPRDLVTAADVVPAGAESFRTFLGVLHGQHPKQKYPARLL
jgi:hypothetical protein